jgi:hypothetical protein
MAKAEREEISEERPDAWMAYSLWGADGIGARRGRDGQAAFASFLLDVW